MRAHPYGRHMRVALSARHVPLAPPHHRAHIMHTPFSSPQHRVHPRRRHTRPSAHHVTRHAHPRQRVLPASAYDVTHHCSTAPTPSPSAPSPPARPPTRYITVPTAASTSSPKITPPHKANKKTPSRHTPRPISTRAAQAEASRYMDEPSVSVSLPPTPPPLVSRCDETLGTGTASETLGGPCAEDARDAE
ncbi:hypothetical protein FB451DRAFT_1408357 [Mycena latifolia]|nr:hypothetical protein FB451DRAFT_1408357 [Mycena latifolia]